MKKSILFLSMILITWSSIGQDLQIQYNKNSRTFNQGFGLVAGACLTGIIYAHQDVNGIPLIVTGAGGLSMMVLASERQKKLSGKGINDMNMWMDPSIRKDQRNQSGWMIASLFYGLSMYALAQDPSPSAKTIGITLTSGFTIGLIAKSLKKKG